MTGLLAGKTIDDIHHVTKKEISSISNYFAHDFNQFKRTVAIFGKRYVEDTGELLIQQIKGVDT